jgi:hypothetical protein
VLRTALCAHVPGIRAPRRDASRRSIESLRASARIRTRRHRRGSHMTTRTKLRTHVRTRSAFCVTEVWFSGRFRPCRVRERRFAIAPVPAFCQPAPPSKMAAMRLAMLSSLLCMRGVLSGSPGVVGQPGAGVVSLAAAPGLPLRKMHCFNQQSVLALSGLLWDPLDEFMVRFFCGKRVRIAMLPLFQTAQPWIQQRCARQIWRPAMHNPAR